MKKNDSRRVLSALTMGYFACNFAWANPTGAQVVAGQVNIAQVGNTLNIVNSPGAVINWQNFSINQGELTRFIQQNSASSVLNRIVGQNPSQILGALQSNGKVYLINPNGILFGAGSQINVAGLVASTLGISNADFIAGRNNFTSSTQTSNSSAASIGSVINQGSITTPSGGNIYLIAPQVQNTGILTSPQGEIILAAGHSVQLVDSADPNIQVVISAPTDQAMNLGQVIAQSGKIGIYGGLVNQNGIVRADTAVLGKNGEIVFKSTQTTMLAENSQTTAADGGTIKLLGPQVGLTDNALVDVSGQTGGGTVLVGGDFHGANPEIQNANAVFVGPNVRIKADAIQRGDGGNVAIWSEDATRFYGKVSAQGGAQGGNGGFVETSGRKYLEFQGLVDLRASNGNTGTLLLDPYDISINDSGGSPQLVAPNFTYSSSITSIVDTATLISQLSSAHVFVQTGAAPGTITVNSSSATPLSWNSANTLSLVASSDVAINSPISAPAGTLVLFSSGGNITQSAPISVGGLSAIATVGNVVLTNANNSSNMIAGIAGGSGGFQFTSGFSSIQVGTVDGTTGITSTGTGGITLSALGASIATLPGATITGPSLNLTAADSIGSPATPLSTSVGTLTITNGGGVNNGDVTVSNTGQPLTIAGITELAGQVAGGIFVSSDNAITVNGAITNNNSNAGSSIGLQAAGNITLNAPMSTTAGNTIALTTTGGNLIQTAAGAVFTTTGDLILNALADVGANGNALITNVGSLTISHANNVYLGNSGVSNLIVNGILANGAVNVSTAGALTAANGIAGTNFTGSSITLVSAGNMSIGNNAIFSAANGTGPINLYAGFIATPGSTPVTNGSASTLTQGGTLSGTPINLFANSHDDFLGSATYSATPNYTPGAVTTIPDQLVATAFLVSGNYLSGFDYLGNSTMNTGKTTETKDKDEAHKLYCN